MAAMTEHIPLSNPPSDPQPDPQPDPEPVPPVPDTRNWTFVIDHPCADCGFDPAGVEPGSVGTRLRAATPRWTAALSRPDAAVRPAPQRWSALEYGAHIRDVCRLFAERLALMLTETDPEFANWDQDVTALEDRYWTQQPAVVAGQLASEAAATALAFDGVRGEQWERTGRRSDGSVFTVTTFGRYFLHDIEHHLYDVRG